MTKRYQKGSKAPDFDFSTPWGEKKNFYADGSGRNKVIFFLRYYGCRVTQLEFRDIAAESAKFSARGAKLYVVLQSSPETIQEALKRDDIDFELICDPEGKLYRLFDIGYAPPGTKSANAPDRTRRAKIVP
ncbi:hypothetical protein FACS1894204_13330 [Synergistales bacterium]|nr:hypothetical protein FACS1894204_13330 [Synergistales bacterium]